MIGDTSEEAQAKYAALAAQVSDIVQLQAVKERLGASLQNLPLDQPVPEEIIQQAIPGVEAGFKLMREMIQCRIMFSRDDKATTER